MTWWDPTSWSSEAGQRKHDEEVSTRLAVQLDAEWNGDRSVEQELTPRQDADVDASLALATRLDAEMNNPGTESQYKNAYKGSGSLPSTDTAAHLRGGGGSSPTTSAKKPLNTLKDFTRIVAIRKCAKCSTQLIQSSLDVEDLFRGWVKGSINICPWVTCKNCWTAACIDCSSTSRSTQSAQDVEGTRVSWCCSRGRLFMIWVVLCGFDQAYCLSKQLDASRSGRDSTPPLGTRTRETGTGYSGTSTGTSALTHMNTDHLLESSHYAWMMHRLLQLGAAEQSSNAQKSEAQKAQQNADAFNEMILALLEALLPSLDRNSRFDLEPPEAVTEMLLSSRVLDYGAELLRNDSLDDASKRKALYQALLSFLRIVGTHPITAGRTMFKERPIRTGSSNILALSFDGKNARPEKETSTPLANGLKNLNIQSGMMLKSASSNQTEFTSADGQDLLWLCRQISDLSEYLLVNMKNDCKPHSHISKEETVDDGVVEVVDEEIFPTHHFAREAQDLRSSQPGRIKRLITEIASLKTGLPQGIYIKYASSRLDVMKFVIVGPLGTPYENGLYEFDLFCPASYPNESPKCYFRGAAEGGSINPNLHRDGKVCLSLLGTWSGEPWRPGESTILQVVISIQAMVFCDKPFFNEPMRSEQEGSMGNASDAYNQKVHPLTMSYAMLNWLEHPPKLWQDMANLHFKRKANRILETAARWVNEATVAPPSIDGFGFNAFSSRQYEPVHKQKLLAKLQEALQKYGANITIQPVVRQQFLQVNDAHNTRYRPFGGTDAYGGRGLFHSTPGGHGGNIEYGGPTPGSHSGSTRGGSNHRATANRGGRGGYDEFDYNSFDRR